MKKSLHGDSQQLYNLQIIEHTKYHNVDGDPA